MSFTDVYWADSSGRRNTSIVEAAAQLRSDTGLEICFADPHSPWQRGTNDVNGLLRQYGDVVPASGSRLPDAGVGVSEGVLQPRVLRGLLLRAEATAARSSGVCLLRSVPFGKAVAIA